MPSGGHSRSGPPPDAGSLRQARLGGTGQWASLPAEGRAGRPPRWPLTEQTDRERVLWRELWKRPQAVMWERLDQRYEVALFARNLERAERPGASIELQKVVRAYLDSLGLSVAGMLRNRWRLAEPVNLKPAPVVRFPSARERLRVRQAPEDDTGDDDR